MSKRIELIARGVVILADRVLLCQNIRKGYYYLPGGHVEFGEGAKEALAREFEEEAGLAVRVGGLVAVSEGSFVQNKKRRHEVNLTFHVKLPPRSKIKSRESHIAFEWMPLRAVAASDVRPSSAKELLRNLRLSKQTIWGSCME